MNKIKIGNESLIEFFLLHVGQFFLLEEKNKKPAICVKTNEFDPCYNSYDYTNKKEIFINNRTKVSSKEVCITYD